MKSSFDFFGLLGSRSSLCVKFLGRNFRIGNFCAGLSDRFVDQIEDFLFLGIDRCKGRDRGRGGRASAFFFFRFIVILRFRTRDGDLTSHEKLIMKDFDRALGFVDIEHLDEPVAFGAVGAAVIDDLDAADGTDTFEELFKIALGRVVGEVSNINAAVLDG